MAGVFEKVHGAALLRGRPIWNGEIVEDQHEKIEGVAEGRPSVRVESEKRAWLSREATKGHQAIEVAPVIFP